MTSRHVLLALHGLAVLAGLGYFAVAVAVADPDGGANIGAGLGLLWLMVLGSPWSWPLLAVDDLSGPLWAAAIIGTAVLNLVLHALLVRRRSRVRACLTIHGGAGRRPDHALAALPTLQRRPVCARQHLANARLDDAGIHQQSSDTP